MSHTRPPLAQRPEGAAGRVFGLLMEAINAPAYRFAFDLLDLKPAHDVLEIGFGTGRMIELMLARTHGRVAGVDPTPTMVAWTRSRAAVKREADRVWLSLGGDGELDEPPASFDRIVALHSFQFWADPAASVRRMRALLRPGGRLVLILRDHSRGGADRLPNPLSRRPDEAEATRRLLAQNGFETRLARCGRRVGVVGEVR
ncbi:MAG TPA: class I SAM-dependent methyltransferase [Caulobacteraceae bacterium]|jgi:SAM-dependent methyltransferase